MADAHRYSEEDPTERQAVARRQQNLCVEAIAPSDPGVGLRLAEQQPHADTCTRLWLGSKNAKLLNPNMQHGADIISLSNLPSGGRLARDFGRLQIWALSDQPCQSLVIEVHLFCNSPDISLDRKFSQAQICMAHQQWLNFLQPANAMDSRLSLSQTQPCI